MLRLGAFGGCLSALELALLVVQPAGDTNVNNILVALGSKDVVHSGMGILAGRDTANHGIGTRSMRALTERYEGLFSAAQRSDVFCLDITLPLPE